MRIAIRGYRGDEKVFASLYSATSLGLLPGFIKAWTEAGVRLEINIVPDTGNAPKPK